MLRYGLSDTLKLLRLYTALVLPNGPILAHSMVLPQVPVSVCTEAKGEVAPNPKQDTAGQWWATSLQVGDPAVPCSPIAGSSHVRGLQLGHVSSAPRRPCGPGPGRRYRILLAVADSAGRG